MNLKHVELVELRNRIAKVNRLKVDYTEADAQLRRWITGIAEAHGVTGQRFNFDPETGEIKITPEVVHYTPYDTLFYSEKATEGQNIWTEA